MRRSTAWANIFTFRLHSSTLPLFTSNCLTVSREPSSLFCFLSFAEKCWCWTDLLGCQQRRKNRTTCIIELLHPSDTISQSDLEILHNASLNPAHDLRSPSLFPALPLCPSSCHFCSDLKYTTHLLGEVQQQPQGSGPVEPLTSPPSLPLNSYPSLLCPTTAPSSVPGRAPTGQTRLNAHHQ